MSKLSKLEQYLYCNRSNPVTSYRASKRVASIKRVAYLTIDIMGLSFICYVGVVLAVVAFSSDYVII